MKLPIPSAKTIYKFNLGISTILLGFALVIMVSPNGFIIGAIMAFFMVKSIVDTLKKLSLI